MAKVKAIKEIAAGAGALAVPEPEDAGQRTKE
jgi:hypothetical protein